MDSDAKRRKDRDFTAFVTSATPSLIRTALLLTDSEAAAQDLLQATFVKVYLAWPRVRQGTATSYARRILVNERTDTWRRTRREVMVDQVPETPAGPQRELGEREEVLSLLRRLPPAQRRVIVLRYYEDLSEQTTADHLGMSVSAVKSATHRAMTTLRCIMTSEEARP